MKKHLVMISLLVVIVTTFSFSIIKGTEVKQTGLYNLSSSSLGVPVEEEENMVDEKFKSAEASDGLGILIPQDLSSIPKPILEEESGEDRPNSICIAVNPVQLYLNSGSTLDFVYPPSIKDIDNNGQIDIVASNSGGIYTWKSDGTVLSGWPYLTNPPYQFFFAPSLADINNDGTLEIFGGAESQRQLGLSSTGITLAGWPQQASGNSVFNQPSAVADLDNNGDYEIVSGTRNQFSPAQVFVWNHDGSVFSGWPQQLQPTGAPQPLVRSIATADINNDSDMEVIVTDGLKVYAWNPDGTLLNSWPITPQPYIQNIPGSGPSVNAPIVLAVGDVNYDSQMDIVVATYNYAYLVNDKRIWIHAFNLNGTEIPNFPIEISGLTMEFRPGITLADLDIDKKLEIIVTTTSRLVVAKHDGTYRFFPQNGFPAVYSELHGAIAANIDNDREIELIAPVTMDNTPQTFLQDAWGEIYAWNPDGTVVSGYPIVLRQGLQGFVPSTMLSVGDINRDGHVEVSGGYALYTNSSPFFPTNTGVYVTSLPGTNCNSEVEWGTFAHDVMHTNWFR